MSCLSLSFYGKRVVIHLIVVNFSVNLSGLKRQTCLLMHLVCFMCFCFQIFLHRSILWFIVGRRLPVPVALDLCLWRKEDFVEGETVMHYLLI